METSILSKYKGDAPLKLSPPVKLMGDSRESVILQGMKAQVVTYTLELSAVLTINKSNYCLIVLKKKDFIQTENTRKIKWIFNRI